METMAKKKHDNHEWFIATTHKLFARNRGRALATSRANSHVAQTTIKMAVGQSPANSTDLRDLGRHIWIYKDLFLKGRLKTFITLGIWMLFHRHRVGIGFDGIETVLYKVAR